MHGVARASSAGTKIERVERAPRSLLVLHTMLAPVVENRTVGGSARGTTLGLDDEANSQTADGGATARAAAFRVAPPVRRRFANAVHVQLRSSMLQNKRDLRRAGAPPFTLLSSVLCTVYRKFTGLGRSKTLKPYEHNSTALSLSLSLSL